MSTSYPFLGILEGQPSYGYDLKRAYDRLFGREKPMAFGQVYATLARLQRDNLIEATATEKQSGPERKCYAITPSGIADLEDWLGRPEELHPNMQAVLFTKVVTAILVNRPVDAYLDVQRAAHLQQMRQLTKQRQEGDLAQVLRADYAMFHLEADLRWIDLTAARIDDLTKEIVDVR